jgi:hypothetical protein
MNVDQAKIVYQNYEKRFFIHPNSKSVELPEAQIYIVIPSYGETGLNDTILSLASCKMPLAKVCVLVVVNDRVEDSENIKNLNRDSIENLEKLQSEMAGFQLLWFDSGNLTDKNAGVGLARKIGLDAVILNCKKTDSNPAMICLDADCTVAENYLTRIEEEFLNTTAEVATMGFDHALLPNSESVLNKGILQYEMFLEYYRLGLWISGYPFYFHTVGSSMAFKAIPYAKSGGMNQRKAGEDFYFLHKLFPHYETIELTGNLVFPSSRISTRVPFGTGRFQQQWLEKEQIQLQSYNPEIFKWLGVFLRACKNVIEANVDFNHSFSEFLNLHSDSPIYIAEFEVNRELEEILKSSPQKSQRIKSFYRWFDGLKVLRFVHFFHARLSHQIPEFAAIVLLPELSKYEGIKEKIIFIRKHLAENRSDDRF